MQLSRLRGEELALPGGGVLLNDCYNANPLSMEAALEHLRTAHGERKVASLGRHGGAGAGGPRVPPRRGRAAARAGSGGAGRGRAARTELRHGRARGAGDSVGAHRRAGPRGAALRPSTRRLRARQGLRAMGLEVIAEAVAVVP